jgi:hypothetical protein
MGSWVVYCTFTGVSLNPHLPNLDVLPRLNTNCIVLLARIAKDSLEGEPVDLSQRFLSETFNRIQRHSVAGWLRTLQNKDLILISRHSKGLQPHRYSLTERVLGDTNILNPVSDLANSLYGPNGLLNGWKYTATWGHGALNASGTLVLAYLLQSPNQVTTKHIARYLRPLVSPRTIRSKLAKLELIHVVQREQDQVALSPEWESNLYSFLDSCDAGTDRLQRGNERREHERQIAVELYRGTGMSNYDLHMLLKRPCVYCYEESSQQEHFPPRRFLEFHGVQSDRLHVWAVCGDCNRDRSAFIRSLPLNEIPKSDEWHFEEGANIGTISLAAGNYHIRRFNDAYESGDKVAAVNAINATIALMRIARMKGLRPSSVVVPEVHARRTANHSTEDSQIHFNLVSASTE